MVIHTQPAIHYHCFPPLMAFHTSAFYSVQQQQQQPLKLCVLLLTTFNCCLWGFLCHSQTYTHSYAVSLRNLYNCQLPLKCSVCWSAQWSAQSAAAAAGNAGAHFCTVFWISFWTTQFQVTIHLIDWFMSFPSSKSLFNHFILSFPFFCNNNSLTLKICSFLFPWALIRMDSFLL